MVTFFFSFFLNHTDHKGKELWHDDACVVLRDEYQKLSVGALMTYSLVGSVTVT